ncbi:acyltransferas-like protein [Halenospora varia]|nr:acyltransferas-like protein [Halenospora varia]
MSARQENVKWVDGLRGLASVLVVITHICRAFDEELFRPTSEEGAKPRILQLPILRVLVQGRIGVSIFSLVTGYVCALKPIRLTRAGTPDAAFTAIAKSAFRRVPRLILPTTIATTIIWFFCQFGVFEVGNRINGWWVNYTSPNMTPYFGDAIKSLLINLITTWTRNWNIYDNNQWTLLPLLKGSMLVYMMLIATAYAKPRYRMMIELALFVYYYVSNDSAFGMQFFFGAFLSDLSQHEAHIAWCQARKWPSRFLAPVFIMFGLLLASYPEDRPEWMGWSTMMGKTSEYIFPEGNETPRFYTGVGLVFISLGIHFSPGVKNILSSKYLLWFGKNSFAVYLLHGALLRSVLVWMYYGFSTPADIIFEDGHVEPGPNLNICGRVRFWFWLPIWFCMLYSIANLWTKYVDPWCARVTESLVKYVTDRPQGAVEQEKPLLPQ